MMSASNLTECGIIIHDPCENFTHNYHRTSPCQNLGFPDSPAEISERYHQAHKYLTSIREEKVWKSFKLCEAEFAYQQSCAHFPACFTPMFLLAECEVHLLRYLMCQHDQYLDKVAHYCDQTLLSAQNVLKSLNRVSKEHFLEFEKEYGLIRLECHVIGAEIEMLQSVIEFKRKNYMSSAHSMARGHNHYKDVLHWTKEQQSIIDKKFRHDHIVNMCKIKKRMNLQADDKLLGGLQVLIDEKTKEIRGMNYDRKSDIPDIVIEATRDLLQMKQLYKDLTGKWKSSDGHADANIRDPLPKNYAESSGRTVSSQFNADFSKNIDDDGNEEDPVSTMRFNDENSKSYSNVFANCNSPVKHDWNLATADHSSQFCNSSKLNQSTQPQNYHENGHFDKIKSPKKMGLPVINVVMPRLGDIARYLDLDQVVDPKLRESVTTQSGANKFQSKTQNGNFVSTSASHKSSTFKSGESRNHLHRDDELMEVLDYPTMLELNPDVFYQHIVLTKSRIAFADAAFKVALSLIPQQISWMLAIIGIKANPIKAVSVLYQLHNFDDCKWNHIATLILLNLPNSYLQELFSSCSVESEMLQKVVNIQRIDQFRPLLEAQSLLKSWTAKNPLWLISSALGFSEENPGNLLNRVDLLRRALASEKDAFPANAPLIDGYSVSTFKYYDVHAKMAKHFVSLGHWTKALSSSRQISFPAYSFKLTLEGYSILRAASAAIIVNEDFSHQTKYLQLKFVDKFIYNNQGTVAACPSQADMVRNRESTKTSDITEMVISMNRNYSLESLVSLVSHQNIIEYDASLYSRLLTFDQYHVMLKNDTAQRHTDADATVREFLCSWCWLLPLELTYITFNGERMVHEASHSQMLQLCDKGALLFAEKYLQNNFMRDETTAQHFKQLKDLITSIIVDELAMKDSIVVKKAISPSCKLKLWYEHSLLTGSDNLRINGDDPMGEKDTAILINTLIISGKQELSKIVLKGSSERESGSAIFNMSKAFQPTFISDENHPRESKSLKLMNKIVDKQTKLLDAVRQSSFTMVSQQISDIYGVFSTQSSDKVIGDIILLWLLTRGCILIEMNRIWEAVMMFKLIECLKETAPQSKFTMFIAYYKLAHLVVTYDICDNPIVIGSEYLKRSSVYMQRALDARLLPYIFQYSSLISDMVFKLNKT